MQKVWKYQWTHSDLGEPVEQMVFTMPSGGRVVRVGLQSGRICLWALGNSDAKNTYASFSLVGTGWPVPERTRYVGSVDTHDGRFVWHIFEHEDTGTGPLPVHRFEDGDKLIQSGETLPAAED